MKWLVISDTHGNRSAVEELSREYFYVDTIVHLGDGTNDLRSLSPAFNGGVISVKGNNDYMGEESRIAEIGEIRVFITHGHKYGVRVTLDRLACEAERRGCAVALYGHTHSYSDTTDGNVRLINPGAVSYPAGRKSCVLIEESGGKIIVNRILL